MPSQTRWLSDVIPVETLGEQAPIARSIEVVERPSGRMCLLCRGGRMLCGKLRCPMLVKAQSLAKHGPFIDSDHIDGATPPGVFVGRVGYPKVYMGPLVPPYYGDTEILDTPEWWFGKPIDEIVDYRFSLIRGSTRAHVFDARAGSRLLDQLQELAMASRSIDSELLLMRRPRRILTLSEDTQPFGPSAPLKSLKQSNVPVDRRIEKAYYDRDLKATDAVAKLYREGVMVTRIQRAFSIGLFGVQPARKLVPTRWSITAVDSIVSLSLMDEVKHNTTIDEYRVHSLKYLDNIYVAILMPETWKFEWIEAWFPHTTWNQYGLKPAMMGDYEEYWGRTTYASIGGCYYSARLAVAEKLSQERRQAAALLLREIHPGYILPVGVWNVRESIRETLKVKPEKFDALQDALGYASSKFTIPLKNWIEGSALLRKVLYQKRITDYVQKEAASAKS